MLFVGTKEIETPRLMLRRFDPSDAPAVYRNWTSDPEVTRYLTWKIHADEQVTERVITYWTGSYRLPSYYNWVIELRQTGEPVGNISVVRTDARTSSAEVGYCLGRNWWHMGIATEALAAVISFLFRETGALRVSAWHDVENTRSGAVMLRCGMSMDGTLRRAAVNNRGLVDMCYYSILKEEWEELRGAEPYTGESGSASPPPETDL